MPEPEVEVDTGVVTGIGSGLFTGIGGCHTFDYDRQGPNGTAIYHDVVFADNDINEDLTDDAAVPPLAWPETPSRRLPGASSRT